jgi:hypothetical protein
MVDPVTITNLAVGAFLLILALVIALAAYLDRGTPRSIRAEAISSGSRKRLRPKQDKTGMP